VSQSTVSKVIKQLIKPLSIKVSMYTKDVLCILHLVTCWQPDAQGV